MTLVLDTNVFISGLRGSAAPAQVLALAKHQQVTFATSPALLEEIERVLTYPRIQALLGDVNHQVKARLADFRRTAYVVEADIPVHAISADPTDNAVLACALAAEADLIVSGDRTHVLALKSFQGIPIVTPQEAVQIIDQLRASTPAA